jgi:hypothetical protein
MNETEVLAGLLTLIGCIGVFWAGYACGFGHGWREGVDQEHANKILEMLKKDYAIKEIKKRD